MTAGRGTIGFRIRTREADTSCARTMAYSCCGDGYGRAKAKSEGKAMSEEDLRYGLLLMREERMMKGSKKSGKDASTGSMAPPPAIEDL